MATMLVTESSQQPPSNLLSNRNSGRVRTGFPLQSSSSNNNILKKNNSFLKSNQTSTWNVSTTTSDEYVSEKHSNYTNPHNHQQIHNQHQTSSNTLLNPRGTLVLNNLHEEHREKMRNQSLDKFEKLAKKKYGSIERLFAAFKKDSSSILTLDEFSEHLRKRNMDLYFPRDEQRLFFEKLDSSHSLKLPVSQIIQHYNSQNPSSSLDNNNAGAGAGAGAGGATDPSSSTNTDTNTTTNTQRLIEETDIKDLILSKIDQRRELNKLSESPRQAKKQLIHSLRNLDPDSTGHISIPQLTWALGPEYLDLGLTEQEIQTTLSISKGVNFKTNEINYNQFVGHLNIRNTDPICDPFFDRRANQITRLKQRLNGLNEFVNDAAILERRDELMKKCMVGPGEEGLKKYLNSSRPTTLFKPLSPSPLMRSCQSQPGLNIGRMVSNSPDSTLPLQDTRYSEDQQQQQQSSLPSNASSPIRNSHHSINTTTIPTTERKNSERGIDGSGGGGDRGGGSGGGGGVEGEGNEKKGIIEGKIIRTGHFRATSNAPSRTHVKYPLTVDVRRAHADHKENLPGGKRHGPAQRFDDTMLHHNNTVTPSYYRYQGNGEYESDGMSHGGGNGEEAFASNQSERRMNLSQSLPNLNFTSSSSSYVSTNDEYFTPLDYQPSKPVSRPGIISDAMKCAMERDMRRRKRYERTRANLQSFKDHAELEKISKALSDASRSKGRVLENLQYELNAFHADLQVHHSRPMETMQRKPNPQLFKKMWGGNLSSSTPTHDDRDFSTTYDRSYIAPSSTSSLDTNNGHSKESFSLS